MSEQEKKEAQNLFERTESKVRHIGYVVFFGLGALIFFPMVLGAIQGVQSDRIWDPFTGFPVSASERVVDCREEVGDLIFLAGQLEEYDSRWERRFRRWVARCQTENPELFDLLNVTRDRLRGVEAVPLLEVDLADPGDPVGVDDVELGTSY